MPPLEQPSGKSRCSFLPHAAPACLSKETFPVFHRFSLYHSPWVLFLSSPLGNAEPGTEVLFPHVFFLAFLLKACLKIK